MKAAKSGSGSVIDLVAYGGLHSTTSCQPNLGHTWTTSLRQANIWKPLLYDVCKPICPQCQPKQCRCNFARRHSIENAKNTFKMLTSLKKYIYIVGAYFHFFFVSVARFFHTCLSLKRNLLNHGATFTDANYRAVFFAALGRAYLPQS